MASEKSPKISHDKILLVCLQSTTIFNVLYTVPFLLRSTVLPCTERLSLDAPQANVQICVENALQGASLQASDLAAVGITNQRESTLVWDKNTGKPLYNLIVWNDVRTESICR